MSLHLVLHVAFQAGVSKQQHLQTFADNTPHAMPDPTPPFLTPEVCGTFSWPCWMHSKKWLLSLTTESATAIHLHWCWMALLPQGFQLFPFFASDQSLCISHFLIFDKHDKINAYQCILFHLATNTQPTATFLVPPQMNWCLREDCLVYTATFLQELWLRHVSINYCL